MYIRDLLHSRIDQSFFLSFFIFEQIWIIREKAQEELFSKRRSYSRAVVVAQLVEWSLLIPEVRGSNPVIGKNLYIMNICLLSTVCWKDQNKEKKAVNGPFKKIAIIQVFSKMHTIQKSIQQCCFRWLFLPFKECCSFSYWHRANSVWCMPKMEKLDYWSPVNFLSL